MSRRLIKVLTEVDLIAAEDTRVSSVLCKTFDIKTSLFSYNAHKEKGLSDLLISKLKSGESIALLSDAGTPTISDPGAYLIQRCIEEGVRVCPIPGPSAVTTLLSVSGFDASAYVFGGFFPRKIGDAHECLSRFSLACPVVFFESPKRILKTFEFLQTLYPEVQAVVGRELSKKFEEFFHGPVRDVYTQLKESTVKGEFVFALKLPDHKKENDLNEDTLATLVNLGLSQKDIQTVTNTLGWPKKKVYDRCLGLQK